MPANRYFVDAVLHREDEMNLVGAELHHLIYVNRKRVGERVELINGQGALAEASIDHITKQRAILSIQHVQTFPPSPGKLILAQALCRQNRLASILEKGTELGVTAFWLFPAERSERRSYVHDRALGLCIAALKQCGRLYLPTLVAMPPIAQWSALPHPAFYGSLSQEAPPLATYPPNQDNLIVIGPEFGLTSVELAKLEELGAQGTALHHNILRTDTAAITALALLSHP